MICFARELLRRRKKELRLRWPSTMVVITGCDREQIDAEFDASNRLTKVIVRTRQHIRSSSARF